MGARISGVRPFNTVKATYTVLKMAEVDLDEN